MGQAPRIPGQWPQVFNIQPQAVQDTFSLFLQGFEMHQKGQLAQAKTVYEQVLARQPRNFDALHLLGVIARQSDNPTLAVELIGKAIEINRNSAAAYLNLGNALQDLKRWNDALASYDNSIAINPNDVDALYNRGNALQELQRWDEALKSYDKAIANAPTFPKLFNNRGNALRELNRMEEALASYEKAIADDPDYVDAIYNLGNALKDLKRLDGALACYDRVNVINPDFSGALINRGNVFQLLKRWDEALANYDRAIAIDSNDVTALTNRGNALQKLERMDEAMASYDRAISINPNYADAFGNRGNALQELKRFDEALASYGKAIAIQPDYAEAHWNESLCRLLIGDFETGWQKYEGRWRSEVNTEKLRQYEEPLWLGADDLSGKTILLYAEQGLGDALQFSRYAKSVASLGASVVLEAPAPLLPLFLDLAGVSTLVEKGGKTPAFDYHCALMSLPLAFKTSLADIDGSPYLRVPEERLSAWKSRVTVSGSKRIGLVWSGGTTHQNDGRRSIELADFKHLLIDGLDYYCLQKEIREWDQVELASLPMVRTFASDLKDFADTAALVSLVDLVITVDTSVAHLAGALGKEVWILLPFVPDWRWMLDRSDSPWYHSATLYRQPRRGDWASVIDMVSQDLKQRLGA